MRKLQCAVVGTALLFMSLNLLASTKNSLVGTVDFSGDPQFDADSISASGPNHWQWLSFPGGRLVLNPSPNVEHIPAPLANDILLNLGGWVGTKTIKLLGVSHVLVGTPGSPLAPAQELNTTWFPYKFAYTASYPGNVQLQGKDFFIDASSSFIRDLTVTSSSKDTMELGGTVVAGGQATWTPTSDVLVVSSGDYIYALTFVSLSRNRALPLNAKVSIQPASYVVSVDIDPGTSEVAIGFGFATASEGEQAAIARAKGCFHESIAKSLAATKAAIEKELRRVPAPQKWGIEGSEGAGVSAERHRQAYYAAWTFIIQDVVHRLPESSFAYDQLMTGKPSLWNDGEPRAPGTAQWDSLLGYQWLCYVDCKAAWSAFAGLMSLVGTDGAITGESLPARKAQTAWILYSRTHDRAELEQLYPAIRKNLLWEEENPRWIWGPHNDPNEKSLEFTCSWIYDAGFASKISTELHNSSDSQMWIDKQAEMAENTRKWFFSDPDRISQRPLLNGNPPARNGQNQRNPRGLSKETTQALAILQEFPPDIRGRLTSYFNQGFQPNQIGMGFAGDFRYPNMNLTAYGLIDTGRTDQAVALIVGVLRDSIQAGTFAEAINKGHATGVEESLFSPLNIIEFTWLLNGCRFDSGDPVYVNLTDKSSR